MRGGHVRGNETHVLKLTEDLQPRTDYWKRDLGHEFNPTLDHVARYLRHLEARIFNGLHNLRTNRARC